MWNLCSRSSELILFEITGGHLKLSVTVASVSCCYCVLAVWFNYSISVLYMLSEHVLYEAVYGENMSRYWQFINIKLLNWNMDIL